MPSRRDGSRSYSRRRPRSDSRKRSSRKERDRKPRRESRSRSRSRDRRGGGRGDRGGGGGGRGDARPPPRAVQKTGKPLPEWGTAGVIQELKAGGIGFIRPKTGKVDDKDLFFHKSVLTNGIFDNLQIGEEVTYEAILDEAKNKASATNVTLVNPPKRSDSRGR
eukprot:TRINITY_DN22067_c3_g1_i1.p2 TRINITY_DN22067_c3_g1~~TRINITY_DN22067_c3_g1_i1.p2  ORF type:complete len:164 (-),score=36.74 TRINITY_DN22067_c3_g1_i1:128-619(-)